jgi:hypothetical protein
MVGKALIAVIRVELFTTMPRWSSSGWRIKYLWEPVRPFMGKERFKQWIYDTAYAEVKHFHGDNGIFASEQYRQECIVKGQTQSFSGVGAQHQNNRVPNRECFVLVTIACAFSCKLERECQCVPNRGRGRGHGFVWGCPAYIEALFSNLEFCADGLEAGPTPAAAIPIDGAVISDSENDSSAASGSSESEGDVAVAVAMAVAVKMVLVITMPMIMMMMAVFLPQLTFLRELRELQLHPALMRVLVGRVVRENP